MDTCEGPVASGRSAHALENRRARPFCWKSLIRWVVVRDSIRSLFYKRRDAKKRVSADTQPVPDRSVISAAFLAVAKVKRNRDRSTRSAPTRRYNVRHQPTILTNHCRLIISFNRSISRKVGTGFRALLDSTFENCSI